MAKVSVYLYISAPVHSYSRVKFSFYSQSCVQSNQTINKNNTKFYSRQIANNNPALERAQYIYRRTVSECFSLFYYFFFVFLLALSRFASIPKLVCTNRMSVSSCTYFILLNGLKSENNKKK